MNNDDLQNRDLGDKVSLEVDKKDISKIIYKYAIFLLKTLIVMLW